MYSEDNQGTNIMKTKLLIFTILILGNLVFTQTKNNLDDETLSFTWVTKYYNDMYNNASLARPNRLQKIAWKGSEIYIKETIFLNRDHSISKREVTYVRDIGQVGHYMSTYDNGKKYREYYMKKFGYCPPSIDVESLSYTDILKYCDTKFLKDGLITQWFENGQKMIEGTYKEGKEDGLKTTWFESGQKESKSTLKDGVLDGLTNHWFENGQKQAGGIIKDGKPNGLITQWFENGQKESEVTFKNGKENGLVTTWFENGQKKFEGTYKNGKIISRKEWNEDGSVKN